ncbi:MAG: DegT/DnrJ/EryC1/StrS family aminotransferase [Gemmatimonadales bacterium]
MTSAQASRTIPFFNYREVFARHEEQLVAVIRDVVRRGAFIMQQDLERFEVRLATYLGVRHAIGVGNATDGLTMVFRALGLRAGDEAILPSHTMVASAAAVVMAGGVPVLIECGADHLVDPVAVAAAITRRTRFVMPVHLNGRTAAMDAIGESAARHRLQIVEDAAQALGSRFHNRLAGTFGRAGVFSFYPAKILGALGDGGAVVTDDDDLARLIRLHRDHGRNADGEVELWGGNSRLDNLQAAVLDLQFDGHDAAIARRRELAGQYHRQLADVRGLVLPPPPDADAVHYDVFQNYEIEAERRDELREFLRSRGVGTMLPWGGKAIHQFASLGLSAKLPVTDRIFTRVLMLPLNTTLADDDVDAVCGAIREFYAC